MNKTPEPVSNGRINSIMEGTSIEGEIRSDSNVRIDGRLKGTINARGRVIIGQSGIVDGEVICQSSDIEGQLNGKINCQDLLSLKATAKLQGDIITKKLAIEPGATFQGSCSMGSGTKEVVEPARPRVEGALASTRPEMPMAK
jgi:cytoskeletal protein CcmA (bactofilin family)